METVYNNSIKRALLSLKSSKSRLLLLLFITPLISFGQSPQTFNTSGSFTVPEGVTSITVQAWGAGGAGGGSTDAGFLNGRGGAGGGGGAYASATITVTPGAILPVVVGVGGSGVSGGNGNTGGFSTITGYTGLIYAAGGNGGAANVSGGSPAGGLGGTVAGSKGSPIAGLSGLNGETLTFPSSASSGAGGAGANLGGAGGAGIGTSGTTSIGNSGNQPGGGGGGARTSQDSGNQTGGAGGAGRVTVSWTCPTYSLTNTTALDACKTANTTTVTLTASAAGLPVGKYTVTYILSYDSYYKSYTAPMTVSTAGTGTFTADVSVVNTSAKTAIRVVNLASSSCSTTITSGNTSNEIYMYSSPVATKAKDGWAGSTTEYNVQWDYLSPNSTKYFLDIATNSSFTAGSFVAGYNNLDVGDIHQKLITDLTPCTTYYYRVRSYNVACGTSANSNVIAFTMAGSLTTPTVGAITHPNCTTPTGSVVLTGLPEGNWTITRSPGAVVIPGTGSSTTISGLDAGTYTFKVSNGTCNSSPTVNVVINAIVTNTWNGTTWSKGTPTNSQVLVINGNYSPSDKDIVGCSITINSGVNVTIKSGRNLIITNGITVSGTGTLTFENNASLVQTNNTAVNVGNIIYNRITPSVRETDYTYWSSPVAGHTLNISPDYAYGTFYSYNPSKDDWISESLSSTMGIGKGYIIRGQRADNTPYNITATFRGVPNNGIKNIAIGAKGTSNLLGNPYPSAINADTFLANNSTVIEGTIYFWTHNTAIQLASDINNGTAGSGVYAYTSDDYASYNVTGGVGVGTGNYVNGVEEIANKPTGKIAAGQAFFTTSIWAGTVKFDNAMRVSSNNTQFFNTKNSKTKNSNTIEKNRVWLNLTNTEGAFKQTLVGYITDATNEYDSRFDGETFDGNEFVDFYSINQEKNLVIQGRALPFDENDEVPLGFKSTIEGNFTISIDETDGVLANQPIFIEDKLTNTVFDLKSGNYTFKTVAGTFNNRFVLRYTNKTLGTNENEVAKNKTIVSVKNKQIKIDSFSETIDKIVIYNLLGRQIYQKDKVNSNEFIIADFVSSQATIIIKTSLQNGDTVSNKVIY